MKAVTFSSERRTDVRRQRAVVARGSVGTNRRCGARRVVVGRMMERRYSVVIFCDQCNQRIGSFALTEAPNEAGKPKIADVIWSVFDKHEEEEHQGGW